MLSDVLYNYIIDSRVLITEKIINFYTVGSLTKMSSSVQKNSIYSSI